MIKVKRGGLVLLLGLWVFLLPEYRIIRPSFVFSLMSFILFLNFPILVRLSNSKPLYYEDLFLNTSLLPKLQIAEKTKETFKKTFTYILVITNSMLSGLLYDYWIIKTKDTTSVIEIVGISGGILKIFQIINHSTGIVTLSLIKYSIKQRINSIDFDDNTLGDDNETDDEYEYKRDDGDGDDGNDGDEWVDNRQPMHIDGK